MRFLTLIKINNNIVSKGYGPNKKDSKVAAAQLLLSVICPTIYQEWQEKIKTSPKVINPNQVQKQQEVEEEKFEDAIMIDDGPTHDTYIQRISTAVPDDSPDKENSGSSQNKVY